MELLDGKLLSAKIKDEVKAVSDSYHKTPILAVITVGNDEASKVYVNNKKKACEYVDMSMMHFSFEDGEKEEKIIKRIKELNKDKNVNGIIIQLPLPKQYDTNKLINMIDPDKDVDGLTYISQGKLLNGEDTFIPCTPKGILEIFDYYKIDLESKHVVIIGRSNLVSKPLMALCLKRNATVTMCHSKTNNLSDFTKKADILIVATGKKYLIDSQMVKKGVIIVDVGITKEDNKLYGDVNPNVKSKASYLTPVPGGVGPMTVCMLLKNTMIAYLNQNKEEKGPSFK